MFTPFFLLTIIALVLAVSSLIFPQYPLLATAVILLCVSNFVAR